MRWITPPTLSGRRGLASGPGSPPATRSDAERHPCMTATPIGPYRPLVRAGDFLISSGQIGAVDGELVRGGLHAELRQAIANLRGLLEAEGAGLGDVVSVTVYLRHMSDYATMNDTYVAEFGDHRPARTACGVSELPLGALVEVQAWAYHPVSG